MHAPSRLPVALSHRRLSPLDRSRRRGETRRGITCPPMSHKGIQARILASVVVAAVALPSAALAEPPSNDQRSSAAPLDLPATLTGTLVEATVDADEPSSCRAGEASVWYRFTAPAGGRLVVLLDAAGDLDAFVELLRRTRSELTPDACEATDSRGQATLDTEALVPGATYLIRVGQSAGSEADRFRLDVVVPRPPAEPPGRPLPRGGATASVSRLVNPSDAWAVRMKEGTSYRVNLDPRRTRCVALAIYPPGTRSFRNASPMRELRCGGYELLTPAPGKGGRYIMVARAAANDRRPQRYHLRVAKAGPDDTAPGIFIGNHALVRGSLRAGGIDVVDLYRFDVVRRSGLFLRMRTRGQMRMILLNDRGQRLDSQAFLIRRGVPAGRYFVAIRSESDRLVPYTLRRISRTITRSRITIDGARRARSQPGAAVQIGVAVAPAVAGTVRIDIERFDPLAGWQFVRRVLTLAVNGRASISFVPPSVGRYRARGLFLRTLEATASETRLAHLLVASPLRE